MTVLQTRWAAKEAAIKAHWRRKLVMKQVEIVTPGNDAPAWLDERIRKPFNPRIRSTSGPSQGPTAIISPTKRYILMNEDVAKQRGLDRSLSKNNEKDRQHFRSYCEQAGLSTHYADSAKIYRRSALYDDNDIQEARISISHDGSLAAAVCIAVDAGEHSYPQITIDTGAGPPMHRPLDSDLKQDADLHSQEHGEDAADPSTGVEATQQDPDVSARQHETEDVAAEEDGMEEEQESTKEPMLESNTVPWVLAGATEARFEKPKATRDVSVLLLEDIQRGRHREEEDEMESLTPAPGEEEDHAQAATIEAEKKKPKSSAKKPAKTANPTKKRGRGRPKKAADPQSDEEEDADSW